jgi:hypothetical protein
MLILLYSFCVLGGSIPSESRIPAKIFSRRGAETQRKTGRAFLLGLSLRLCARHSFGTVLVAAGRAASRPAGVEGAGEEGARKKIQFSKLSLFTFRRLQ